MVTRAFNLKIGDILFEKGVITREQLENALKEQQKKGADSKKIGSYLIDLGYVTESDIATALGIQFNLPVMRLEGMKIKPEVIDLVPEKIVRKFNIIPLFKIGDELTIAISDPTDISLLDAVGAQSKSKIIPVIAPYLEITKAIIRNYSTQVETEQSELSRQMESPGISRIEVDELRKAGADLPVVKVVDRMLIDAVLEKASDIHVEPREDKLVIRCRIDGILSEVATYPQSMHKGVVSRIKILSSLDISERQKPQDGRVKIKIEGNEVDIRVSTLPTIYGEKAVLRLLNKNAQSLNLDDLNMSEKNLETLRQLIEEPYGIVLVTGPTGSGKTTTLYAALNEINSIEDNIVTVEDPVEYQLPLINQIQINPKKDLTFANALRSILRQDPDIIMIGEIRDPETASIAAESALTGHLVLSTLHTNDAASSITRLIDMGVEPFLIAPSLLGIVAQRLVRKICRKCSEEFTPSKRELDILGLGASMDGVKFHRGTGCEDCKKTGYSGRTGIYEIMVIDSKIRELITARGSTEMMRQQALKSGFKDMRFDGIRKVLAGITTIEELLRATRNMK
ncbi:MAG: Flp pilus assembly complex ATPase component TadA [Nitrospirae bacterium]|nr:Flp pilus assembly complex ATPase component TadA [Nitrospirota bacterium]